MCGIITMYYYINMSDIGITCDIIKLNSEKIGEGTKKEQPLKWLLLFYWYIFYIKVKTLSI